MFWREIRCDVYGRYGNDDCASSLNHGPQGFETEAELRRAARSKGWHAGFEDICPSCLKAKMAPPHA